MISIQNPSFWQEIFNIYGVEFQMDLVHFMAYFIAMGIGALLFFGLDVWHSKSSNPNTPNKFSFKFMILDNILRFFIVLLLMAVSVLFYEDMFNSEINVKLAFWHGFGIDGFAGTLLKKGKDVGMMKKQRDKLITKYS